MEIFGNLVGGIANVASGGILGLFGSLLGGVFKFFQKKQENSFKKEEWAHENDLLRLNMEAAKAQTDNELAIVTKQGSMGGLKESIRADSRVPASYPWVSAFKSLVRPFITFLLIGIVVYMYSKGLPKELEMYVVQTVVFTASTAILWWFGDRAFTPSELKNK